MYRTKAFIFFFVSNPKTKRKSNKRKINKQQFHKVKKCAARVWKCKNMKKENSWRTCFFQCENVIAKIYCYVLFNTQQPSKIKGSLRTTWKLAFVIYSKRSFSRSAVPVCKHKKCLFVSLSFCYTNYKSVLAVIHYLLNILIFVSCKVHVILCRMETNKEDRKNKDINSLEIGWFVATGERKSSKEYLRKVIIISNFSRNIAGPITINLLLSRGDYPASWRITIVMSSNSQVSFVFQKLPSKAHVTSQPR